MKKSLLFYLAFFLVFLLANCNTSLKSNSTRDAISDKNLLALYGQHIYERESCSNCHTLNIEEENSQLVSLDGLGNKYPYSWYYYYFYEPQVLIPDSKKESYVELYIEELDKELMSKIIEDHNLGVNQETYWIEVITQAEQIKNELKRERISAYNNEIIALLAYLRQIPPSKRMKELDSLEHVETLKKEKIWDDILNDSSSLASIIVNNKDEIIEGKSLFSQNCSPCHGNEGGGMIGPNLTDDYWLHGKSKTDIANTIVNGVPHKGMISWKAMLSPDDVGKLVAYISSIQGTNPSNSKPPQGEKE